MDQQVRPTFNPGLRNGSIGDKNEKVHASLETKLNRKMIPQVTQKVVFYCIAICWDKHWELVHSKI